MTLQELQNELFTHVRDEYLRDNYFKAWLNEAIRALAKQFDLPALKLKEPFNHPVNTGAWLYDMDESFCHKVFKARNVNWNTVTILDNTEYLDAKDIDHDETGDEITHIAVDGRVMGVYPKANDTVRLWFFERPGYLDLPTDPCTCIPDEFQRSVIIPKAVLKAYPVLQDLGVSIPDNALAYWTAQLSIGLYGSPQGEIGMVHWLAAQEPLRKTGGRDPLP